MLVLYATGDIYICFDCVAYKFMLYDQTRSLNRFSGGLRTRYAVQKEHILEYTDG